MRTPMENIKTLEILAKLSINGYSDEHAEEELYLQNVLRTTTDMHLYALICAALGNAGGLFNVPTLIAHSIGSDQRAELAKLALNALEKRLKPASKNSTKYFFKTEYWKPIWVAPKERFISYVACLHGLASQNVP